ncbi:hypothetical protein ACHWQZ_G008445 [Mnemiopsis leidyi]
MFLNDSNPSSQVLNADQYNNVEEKPKRVTHSTYDDSTRSRYSQWNKPWQRRNIARDYSSSRSRSRDRPTDLTVEKIVQLHAVEITIARDTDQTAEIIDSIEPQITEDDITTDPLHQEEDTNLRGETRNHQ